MKQVVKGAFAWPARYKLFLAVMLAASASIYAQQIVSPAVATLLQEVQTLMATQKYDAAKSKLSSILEVKNASDYEKYIVNRQMIAVAVGQEDVTSAARYFDEAERQAESAQWMTPTEKIPLLKAIATLYARNKDYANGVIWTDRFEKAGGVDAALSDARVQMLFRNGEYARAAKLLDAQIRIAIASGVKPSNINLEMLAQSSERIKDDVGYGASLELLLEYYPKKQYWQALLTRLWNKPDLPSYLQIEVGRLNLRTDTLVDTADYIEFAEIAIKAGYPIDAVTALDKGFSSNTLGKGADASKHNVLRTKAQLLLEQDRKVVNEDALKAAAAGDANSMANIGFNLVLLGQTVKGQQLMQQALNKGVTRRPELIKLHLGIAYVLTAQKDEAKKVLSLLATAPSGIGEVARYWMFLAASV